MDGCDILLSNLWESMLMDSFVDHPCCMDHGALAPSAGEHCCCMESAEWQSGPALHNIQIMDEKLRPIRAHLEYLLNKADEYQAHLLHRCCASADFYLFCLVVCFFFYFSAPWANQGQSATPTTTTTTTS